MDFELRDHAGALQDAFWEVKFIADQTNKRKIVGTLSPRRIMARTHVPKN